MKRAKREKGRRINFLTPNLVAEKQEIDERLEQLRDEESLDEDLRSRSSQSIQKERSGLLMDLEFLEEHACQTEVREFTKVLTSPPRFTYRHDKLENAPRLTHIHSMDVQGMSARCRRPTEMHRNSRTV